MTTLIIQVVKNLLGSTNINSEFYIQMDCVNFHLREFYIIFNYNMHLTSIFWNGCLYSTYSVFVFFNVKTVGSEDWRPPYWLPGNSSDETVLRF